MYPQCTQNQIHFSWGTTTHQIQCTHNVPTMHQTSHQIQSQSPKINVPTMYPSNSMYPYCILSSCFYHLCFSLWRCLWTPTNCPINVSLLYPVCVSVDFKLPPPFEYTNIKSRNKASTFKASESKVSESNNQSLRQIQSLGIICNKLGADWSTIGREQTIGLL